MAIIELQVDTSAAHAVRILLERSANTIEKGEKQAQQTLAQDQTKCGMYSRNIPLHKRATGISEILNMKN